jgi:hypothetical protein
VKIVSQLSCKVQEITAEKMGKLLVGITTVIILLVCNPMKSAPIIESESNQVTAAITNDIENNQVFLVRAVNATELNNSELTQTGNLQIENAVIESEQTTGDSDRVVFVSIGSLVLLGIFLLLPSTKLT